MDSQDKDFKYFIKNHDTLLSLYPDQYLVISHEKVITYAETFEEALDKALKKNLIPGNFIIQECSKGTKGYTQKFHSRVIFK